MMKILLKSILFLSAANMIMQATTVTVVAPNAQTSDSGQTDNLAPFGPDDWTYQWDFAASQFSTVSIGSTITSIGFRQSQFDGDAPDIEYNLPRWDLQLSSGRNAIGSLAKNFLANIGADVVMVRSGSLTVPVNSFQGNGTPPGPFFVITFQTPYIYTGGDLLATLRKQGSSPETSLYVDSITGGSSAFVNSVASAGDTATSGSVNFYHIPIAQFTFETPVTVPEPSAYTLFGSGLLGFAVLARRRRNGR